TFFQSPVWNLELYATLGPNPLFLFFSFRLIMSRATFHLLQAMGKVTFIITVILIIDRCWGMPVTFRSMLGDHCVIGSRCGPRPFTSLPKKSFINAAPRMRSCTALLLFNRLRLRRPRCLDPLLTSVFGHQLLLKLGDKILRPHVRYG